MIGALFLSIYLVSLPWVWVNVFPGFFNVRPALVFGIPLILYYLVKGNFRIKTSSYKVILTLIIILIIWSIPSYTYENPHWQFEQIVKLVPYTLVAYFTAHGYLLVSSNKNWKHYWPIVATVTLASIIVSYYQAFGSLIPNTRLISADDFIHNALHSNVFQGQSGKGIRHTMALIPVLLLAMIMHNKDNYTKLNYVFTAVALYLVFYTFSRSAWLASALIVLLFFRLVFRNFSKKFLKIFMLSVALVSVFLVVILMYPEKFSWFVNIFSDRLGDDRSTGGRWWVIGFVIVDTTFNEYLIGYDREFQQGPHNLMLDALMQSGILGMIGAAVIVYYVVKMYFKGLFKPSSSGIIIAAFAAMATVRLFTAGSGFLHIAEIFGICVAANFYLYNRYNRLSDAMYQKKIIKHKL